MVTTEQHPACKLCAGACCTGIHMKIENMRLDPDTMTWLRYHGKTSQLGTFFPIPCQFLKDGKCNTYEHRPQLCKDWKVGCKACRTVVRELRPQLKHQIFALMENYNVQETATPTASSC